jgi:hypothetical protein
MVDPSREERMMMTAALRSRQGPWALAGVLLAFLGRASAESPALVEWHRTILFPRLASILQGVSGAVLTTLGEVGVLLTSVLCFVVLAWRRRLVIGVLTFAAGLAISSFYGFWGLAYGYPPLGPRLAPAVAPAAAEFAELAEKSALLVARASARGIPFGGPEAEVLARIDAGLLAGFLRLPETLEASPVRTLRFGPIKASRVSSALSWLQLSGYYLPWTGEAQLNVEMPRSLWPRVAAHEKAHQRGFARENEATVIGVLACLSSPDPVVRYSGALGLFASFDRDLGGADPSVRRRAWASLPPLAVEDLRQEAAFWKVHAGFAGALSEKANDAYLKAQGIRSGVGSYSETTGLFVLAVKSGLVGLGSGESRR